MRKNRSEVPVADPALVEAVSAWKAKLAHGPRVGSFADGKYRILVRPEPAEDANSKKTQEVELQEDTWEPPQPLFSLVPIEHSEIRQARRKKQAAGRKKDKGRPYHKIVLDRVLDDLQPSGFIASDKKREHRMFEEAYRMIIRKNIQKQDSEVRDLAGEMAKRDKKRADFWSDLSEISERRSASVSLGGFSLKHLLREGRSHVVASDPFLENLFEDEGIRIKEFAHEITGLSVDSMKVKYAGRNFSHPDISEAPEQKMHALNTQYDVSGNAMRWSDLASFYRNYLSRGAENRWDRNRQHVRVRFAEVVDNAGQELMGMEFLLPTDFTSDMFESGSEEKYLDVMRRGELVVKWQGKELSKDKKQVLLRKMFASRDTEDDEVAVNGVVKSGEVFVWRPQANGTHPDGRISQVHKNGAVRVPRVEITPDPMGKHIHRVAAAFFRP